jgi:hypothetical protein
VCSGVARQFGARGKRLLRRPLPPSMICILRKNLRFGAPLDPAPGAAAHPSLRHCVCVSSHETNGLHDNIVVNVSRMYISTVVRTNVIRVPEMHPQSQSNRYGSNPSQECHFRRMPTGGYCCVSRTKVGCQYVILIVAEFCQNQRIPTLRSGLTRQHV